MCKRKGQKFGLHLTDSNIKRPRRNVNQGISGPRYVQQIGIKFGLHLTNSNINKAKNKCKLGDKFQENGQLYKIHKNADKKTAHNLRYNENHLYFTV